MTVGFTLNDKTKNPTNSNGVWWPKISVMFSCNLYKTMTEQTTLVAYPYNFDSLIQQTDLSFSCIKLNSSIEKAIPSAKASL